MNYNKYKKIINETLCTKTMDYSRLLNIPNYVLQLILYISKFYPSRETSKELNWKPKYNLFSGLKKTINFYDKNI